MAQSVIGGAGGHPRTDAVRIGKHAAREEKPARPTIPTHQKPPTSALSAGLPRASSPSPGAIAPRRRAATPARRSARPSSGCCRTGRIDDRRAAGAVARTEARVRRHGPRRVLAKLMAMQIDRDLAKEVVRDLFGEHDEDDLLETALDKRLRGKPERLKDPARTPEGHRPSRPPGILRRLRPPRLIRRKHSKIGLQMMTWTRDSCVVPGILRTRTAIASSPSSVARARTTIRRCSSPTPG